MIISVDNEIFSNPYKLRDFLINNTIVPTTKVCIYCSNVSYIQPITSESSTIVYRCTKKGCQRRMTSTRSKIPLTRLVQMIYFLLLDINYRQLYMFFSLSDKTIAKIKKALTECYRLHMNTSNIAIGGPGQIVEVDETVISRRGVIRTPSSHDDAAADTVWIVGVVDRSSPCNFFLKRVENRQVRTLTDTLRNVICADSVLHTDGYPSYPSVAVNLELSHTVVNHSNGFITMNGAHTNSIEGFWAHLKNTMRKEHGVKRVNIDEWLIQYTFKRRYVLHASRDEFGCLFCDILKIYFE